VVTRHSTTPSRFVAAAIVVTLTTIQESVLFVTEPTDTTLPVADKPCTTTRNKAAATCHHLTRQWSPTTGKRRYAAMERCRRSCTATTRHVVARIKSTTRRRHVATTLQVLTVPVHMACTLPAATTLSTTPDTIPAATTLPTTIPRTPAVMESFNRRYSATTATAVALQSTMARLRYAAMGQFIASLLLATIPVAATVCMTITHSCVATVDMFVRQSASGKNKRFS